MHSDLHYRVMHIVSSSNSRREALKNLLLAAHEDERLFRYLLKDHLKEVCQQQVERYYRD